MTEKFWMEYFKTYDILIKSHPYKELIKITLKELKLKPNERVLDAGCGTGNFSKEVAQFGAEVIGIDNIPTALSICRTKHLKIQTVCADLTSPLPFPNNYFDKIILNNTLYLIPKEKRNMVLKELYKVLKSGGKIAVTNPKKGAKNIKIIWSHLKENVKKEGFLKTFIELFKNLKSILKMLYFNFFIKRAYSRNFFTKEEQEKILEANGFTIVRSYFVYANQAIFTLAKK